MVQIQKKKTLPQSTKIMIDQLERLLNNPDFHASPQQKNFLKFVVKKVLAGNAGEIKGYTVATEVFGRKPDFDQSVDPVVSIQAGRLRRALERYYLTAGKHDPIRIDIPKGTYVPTFTEQLSSLESIAAETDAAVGVIESWPSIMVRPLANLTGNPADNHLSIGLTTELAHALSHYREIRVLESIHQYMETAPREAHIDFMVDGNIRRDPEHISVAIRLHDARQGIQIWSGKYWGNLDAAKMIAFQEDLASEVAVLMAGDNAIISKHLAGISRKKKPTELTTYEAMLRFWEYNTQQTPHRYTRALQAMEYAVDQEPGLAQAWAMLACLYADNHSLEIVDISAPLEKARAYAEKGVCLDPTSRIARLLLGYVMFLENKLPEARQEAQTAHDLCPNSLMLLDAIGWLMAYAGEWERGVTWIEKAMRLNPYYRPWVQHAVCINWFRKENYDKAYRETSHFISPTLFWEPLLKAAACGHLGAIDKGQACAKALLALKPDFGKRGRILLGRLIKFEDILDRIIEGLEKLDMKVA